MLWTFHTLRGMPLHAQDGEVGTTRDLLFDDGSWAVRYLVVETGSWLSSRRVLIAPQALRRPDAVQVSIPVDLTRDEVKHSPRLETDRPVSRQEEEALHGHYGWVPYWSAPMAGAGLYPAGFGAAVPAVPPPPDPAGVARSDGDPRLRSAREVEGYHIAAEDGAIGHVETVLIDDEGWTIRYLVVDTRNWLPGRKVLIGPQWVRRVDWAASEVTVALTRRQIESSPPYDPDEMVARGYEERLHDHYGAMPYW